MMNRKLYKYIYIAVIFSCIFSPFSKTAVAQDSSKSFFKSDFASSPLNSRGSGGFSKKGDFFTSDRESRFGQVPSYKKDTYGAHQKKQNKQDFSPSNAKDCKKQQTAKNLKGDKILHLGMIVNGVEDGHLEDSVERLIKTVDKYDLDIGDISIIGYPSGTSKLDPTNSENIILALLARRGIVRNFSTPPEEYNLKHSPTWVVQLEEGIILLDGVEKIDKYINRKGEFMDKGVPSELAIKDPIIPQSKSLFDK